MTVLLGLPRRAVQNREGPRIAVIVSDVSEVNGGRRLPAGHSPTEQVMKMHRCATLAQSYSPKPDATPIAGVGRRKAIAGLLIALSLTTLGRGSAFGAEAIKAVGAESEYADVISQIGGKYVEVSAIESNPNTDPHAFEVSPTVAARIAAAEIVVKNGVGYDSWADKIIAAAPNSKRRVIDVQHLLGLPDDTPNPHLWYDRKTMPVVAKALADDFSALVPLEASYFRANLEKFDKSLKPWTAAISSFKASYGGTPVAVTEPVANYMLQAIGCDIATRSVSRPRS